MGQKQRGDGYQTVVVLLVIAILLSFIPVSPFMPVSPLAPRTAYAQCPTTLTVNPTAHPWLLVDSNKPGEEGPLVTTVYGNITNTGSEWAYDVYAYVGDGVTPGTFLPGTDPLLQSLGMLGGVGEATRYVGDLAPGAER